MSSKFHTNNKCQFPSISYAYVQTYSFFICLESYNINVSKTSETWIPKVLKQFNVDTSSQFKKLQNVKNYNDLGFCTVPLYFLDDINIINDLMM